jgi:hypothetical protein
VGARAGGEAAAIAADLLETQQELSRDAREYLVIAGMIGSITGGKKEQARELWKSQGARLREPGKPLLRLLRCHAETTPGGCAAEFRAYAR